MLNAHFDWRRALKITTMLGLVASSSATFAASDWTVGSFSDAKADGGCATIPTNATNASSSSSYGNSVSCQTGTVGGNTSINFSINAWSTTGLASNQTVTNLTTGTEFETANLAWYAGGFGVRNQAAYSTGTTYRDWNTSGQHSMDNSGQTDLIMLSFSSPIVLESVLLGWGKTDSDISVMRYAGSASSPSPLNLTANGLTSIAGGWELVGHYLGTATSGGGNLSGSNALRLTDAANNVASPDSSSFWLISAYNASYGATGKYGNQDLRLFGGGADMVKVLGIAGSAPVTNRTPEPGSLALVGLALTGMLALRKRRIAATV